MAEIVLQAGGEDAGCRVDLFLSRRHPEFSRRLFQRLIAGGRVSVAGRAAAADRRLRAGEEVRCPLPEPSCAAPLPVDLPLEILYEDRDLLAVNKPAGLVVHPGAGHSQDTLVGALLHRGRGLSAVAGAERPGIVHRLDRDTSGVLLVARNDIAHLRLARQFAERTVAKTYLAVVEGQPQLDADLVRLPLAKTRFDRVGVRRQDGREAETEFRARERLGRFALLEVRPRTGRTHQIRVHLAAIGHPVVADAAYGCRARLTRADLRPGDEAEALIERQALHAWKIAFAHPADGRPMELTAPPPADFERLLAALRFAAGAKAPGASLAAGGRTQGKGKSRQ